MAVYNLSPQQKDDDKIKRNKNIGVALISVSSFVFFVLLTSFLNFLKAFVLGVFGLFAYPLFLTIMLVGVAFLNNKKYVMTTKYIVYLSLTIVFALCIFHMLFIDTTLAFLSYIEQSYIAKNTVFGLVGGILTAPFLAVFNKAASFVIFSVAFVIFAALLADYIYYLKKSNVLKKSVSLNLDIKSNSDIFGGNYNAMEKKQERQVVFLDKNKNTQNNMGGYTGISGVLATNMENSETLDNSKLDLTKKENIKKYLLTPETNVNFNKYKKEQKQSTEVTDKIIQGLKTLQTSKNVSTPNFVVHDDIDRFSNFATESSFGESFLAPKMEEENEQIQNDNSFVDLDINLDNDVFLAQDENIAQDQESRIVSNKIEDFNANLSGNFESAKTNTNIIDTKAAKVAAKQSIIDVKKSALKSINVYNKPPLYLLTTKSMDLSELNEDVFAKSELLENTLNTFGIAATVNNVTIGPAVTRYELNMPAGVSVKKVISHSDDIALSLASSGGLRIEAPIPGKSAVGIEVPNKKIATISLKDIIDSNEFADDSSPLAFALGKDINGKVKICDLAKMPHLLVAGSTGSGKSVCLNAVILSIIYKTSPDDVRFLLIDPKQVEFSTYNGLPHLLVPNVITETDKALSSLNWAVNEMERRYTIFKNNRVRDIKEFSRLKSVVEGKEEKMPYIVIIIDELADLLMQSKKDAEEKIARLAQKARSAGIHLILATQRPSVDVITGTIKNNFTSRISFKLMSFADSKTILDQGGAEKLLGKGDMLYKPSDAGEPRRIQCCFVSGEEVNSIVDYVKEKNQGYDYDCEIAEKINNPNVNQGMAALSGDSTNNVFDPLMGQALRIVLDNGQASMSLLQRRLFIGYPRAARIIDQMEQYNFVSAQDGSKSRTILITEEEYNDRFGDDY